MYLWSLIEIFMLEICLKSWFLKVDERELENLNKEGCKVDKYTKLQVKNELDEWWKFCGYDIERSIVNLSQNEEAINGIVHKKNGSLYPQPSMNSNLVL